MSRQFGTLRRDPSVDRVKLLVWVGAATVLLILSIAAVVYFGASSTEPQAVVPEVEVTHQPEIRMVDVLVPAADVAVGAELTEAMFRKESRPAITVDTSKVVTDVTEMLGRYSRSELRAGEPIRKDLVTNVRPLNPLIPKIPPGYRAVSINVDARTSVEGWARPGAKVDVLWLSRIGGKAAISCIVQNAEILSAERQTTSSTAPGAGMVPSTVTLLVSSQDATKIQLASNSGTLTLNLRGEGDNKDGNCTAITTDSILGGDGSSKVAASDCTLRMNGQKYALRDGKLELCDAD